MLPNPNHTEDAGLTWDLGPGSTLPGENREKTAKLHKALVLLHLPHLQSGSPVFPPLLPCTPASPDQVRFQG